MDRIVGLYKYTIIRLDDVDEKKITNSAQGLCRKRSKNIFKILTQNAFYIFFAMLSLNEQNIPLIKA